MKRFRFPLDSALRLREQQWKAEQARLETLLAEIAGIERLRSASLARRAEAEDALFEDPSLSGADLTALAEYRQAVSIEQQRLSERLSAASQAADRQRETVVEAHRKHRLLERLKEKRLDEWRTAADREIEAEAGELFLARHTNRSSPRQA